MTDKESNNIFDKYELDRDIPDELWNNYLKKYDKTYRIFMGEDRIWRIRCKYGHIEPYSLKKGFLSFYGNFPSPLKKTLFLKKIKDFVEIRTEGYNETVIKFLEQKVPFLLRYLLIKKRNQISEEGRKRLRDNMLKMHQDGIMGKSKDKIDSKC